MEETDICICNGASNGKMIRCNSCGTWYHCSCVGVDESEAESMNGFICEFCSFENPEEGDDEEEYVFEKDVATKHKKTKFESHRSGNYSNLYDGNGACVEEMNENAVMTAICQIEQKLLLEDHSPSIHDKIENKPNVKHTNVLDFINTITGRMIISMLLFLHIQNSKN